MSWRAASYDKKECEGVSKMTFDTPSHTVLRLNFYFSSLGVTT